MSEDLPKGYTRKCGKFNGFGMYVYAHWNDKLDHTCECGVKNTVLRGRLIRSVKPRKVKKNDAAVKAS